MFINSINNKENNMSLSTREAMGIALVPGQIEQFKQYIGDMYLRMIADRVQEVRNCVYVGAAVTTAGVVGAVYLDGGYSLASGALATVAAGYTGLVAKNLYDTTMMFRTHLLNRVADNVRFGGM